MDEIDENIFAEFVKMRKSIKKPLTEHAIKLARNKLEKFRQAGHDVNEILNQSIFYNWQGLFEVKTNEQITGSQGQGFGGERRRTAGEAAKRLVGLCKGGFRPAPCNNQSRDESRGTGYMDNEIVKVSQVEIVKNP